MPEPTKKPSNFIADIIEADLKAGRHDVIITRFPPEPNGYPHIGHAQSIWLNFELADAFGGKTNLRFDDTNPETEDIEYVNAIKRDVQWLGYQWERELYASDYFEQLYQWAVKLIEDGKAYVDDLSDEEIRTHRGTVTEPGTESPYRNRSVEENLDLFARMRAGAFGDGEKVLRAKIDMAHPNMKMRDPLMYRIRHAHHYRHGDGWCIYPMYDWAHGQSDAIEGITHSICTLEFENNRELYDWFIDNLGIENPPHQYEFARLNLEYTITSKRKLLRLVKEGHVAGWDDPRMPTLSAMRRRGVTPEAIRTFAERVGVTRVNSRIDLGIFEHAIRDDLNHRAPRVMAVLRPLKVVITNYPEDQVEWLDAPYWPHDVPREGARKVPFSRVLYIERDDFMEDPPKKFFRLAPGREVRLRYGYFITCDEVVKDANGQVVELRCTYDPATRGGDAPDGRNPKATLHWVSAAHSVPAEVRLYDRLFASPTPDEGDEDFTTHLNPESLVVLNDARLEPSVLGDPAETRYQFERQGYFWRDPEDSTDDALVFNRIISLRDSWAKQEKNPTPPRASRPKETKPSNGQQQERRDPVSELSTEEKARYDDLNERFQLQGEEAVVLSREPGFADLFLEAVAAHDNPQALANWTVHEVRAATSEPASLPFTGEALARLVALIDANEISSRIAKDVFEEMLTTGEAPDTIVEKRGLKQVSDVDVLVPVVENILSRFPDKVARYRDGKTGLIGFFMGQVMRETSGKADPELAKALLQERL